MDYLLLTGGTGLLGSYLLGEMARAGVRTAVVVRSTRFEPARHRLEAVFTRWERQAGHALPRPVLLEGDLLRSGLGLSSAERGWVARNCSAVFHNAASLTFDGEKPDGEPFRTNVDGTRQLLDFCREAGIRNFHHVSTAYVAGQRKGRIYENELEAGQEFRNVYEVSKFRAEKLVRDAEFLESRTIYRPGIILGDSRTGHTTTFHAFYVPLKLVATLLSKLPADFLSRDQLHAAGERLREILRLDGTERKNFVTVDWVSRVMASIYARPEHHGKTFHLTPRERTPMSLVQNVIQDVFFDSLDRRKDENRPPELDWAQFEKFFLEGMEVYRSHWADDPDYDAANTIAAVPHLPPPVFDAAMMGRMCQFALETNFGWPRPACPKPLFDVQERLLRRFQPRSGESSPRSIGLQVTGSGGGDWELDWDGRGIAGFDAGIRPRAAAVCRLSTRTLERMASRQTSAEQAIATGAVLIEGKGPHEADVIRALQEAFRE